MKIFDTIEGKRKLNLSFKSLEWRVLTDVAVIILSVTITIDIRKLNHFKIQHQGHCNRP